MNGLSLEYHPILIEPDNGPVLDVSAAAMIAQVNSRKPNSEQTNWTELTLYRTQAGKYICVSVGRSTLRGHSQLTTARLAENIEEVKQFFEYKWLAKNLYEVAGISTTIHVD